MQIISSSLQGHLPLVDRYMSILSQAISSNLHEHSALVERYVDFVVGYFIQFTLELLMFQWKICHYYDLVLLHPSLVEWLRISLLYKKIYRSILSSANSSNLHWHLSMVQWKICHYCDMVQLHPSLVEWFRISLLYNQMFHPFYSSTLTA